MSDELPSLKAGDAARWYAAYTCSRQEKVVARQLSLRNVQHYLPLYSAARQWGTRKAQVTLPLFAGYVFVRIGLQQQLNVLTIPGMVRLVAFGGKPVPLDDDEMNVLQRALSIRRAEPHPIAVGKRVRIEAGPLAGLEGVVSQRRNHLRLLVSIQVVMQTIAIEIAESDLALVA